MVIGRITAGGDSNTARKIYELSFEVCSIQKKADLIGIASSHDDALVMEVTKYFDVKRMLDDGESAMNVLIWEAILCLKIFPRILKVVTIPFKVLEGQLRY